jgi:enoyl-CoA hydratase
MKQSNSQQERNAMADGTKMLLQKEGPLGWIVFNQAEKRNAVSREMWQMVPDMAEDLEEDEEIRVIILRGAGDQAFVAGADISQFQDRRRNMDDELEYRRVSGRGSQSLTNIRKPLLAMIHGYCVGGWCRHRHCL